MGLNLSTGNRVTPEQRRDARQLRREQTPAEDLLWQALRGRKLAGLKFRRQQPVMGFVLDFYCESCNLAVELDGSVHDEPDVAARDREREWVLRGAGIRFLRFKNKQVEDGMNTVLEAIQAFASAPPPLRGGEGAGSPTEIPQRQRGGGEV